ncbi:glycerol-3-phosphate dehydrogenase [Rhodovulum sulfidophilum]|uniref:Glycerol-3-phosphate dehydrogenase n=1 Tax=Rhodovulum visakhapatnamense TaxID=364297 RepID=A0ABS1RCZ9_9RHOB|nr:glycerol-3-phosphate dehydrogenase [Rhodovulum visakhapatnamense]MBL3568164.1 glycerol-3-phosphate dehydrogenase [Rhodovulum visakhapatnamense]MBL3577503.1 glycerol-3-phosphate dehydrogenase [Rhodovulum visakhapatnamense]OLS45304.1 glycerol-3-phosphate dehydrogenase [Rhodovulum sulfidophilum]
MPAPLASPPRPDPTDLLIVGGGINGCGIARDAAGRGLTVTLAEMGDLASATSSASTKLFHGGLRYLEYFEVRLVREALIERETLLRAMPHISWPMRFVLPLDTRMRFDASTPASKLLTSVLPWMKGRRPAWMIRLGLFLYDSLGGRKILPATRTLDLATDPAGQPLKDSFQRAYEYSDCWIEDARLVALNARDAAERGAEILVRTRVIGAARGPDVWTVTLRDQQTGEVFTRRARMLVNAAGPWAGEVIGETLHETSSDRVRLVRGSHIVTRKLFDHDRCYFFQGQDGRIVFAIPYETDFTLIGTTDAEHADPDTPPVCTETERDYLLAFVNRYFRQDVTVEDIVWTYSGVRPLHDEGEGSATAASRDYVVKLDRAGAPLLNIFGGKITTYRRLAESALEKIAEVRKGLPGRWTAGVPLPGGDFPVDGVEDLIARLKAAHPFLTDRWAHRLVRAYGTQAADLLDGARSPEDLGRDFGATLTEAEVRWLMDREFAREAADVVWRRSKLGLRLSRDQIAGLDAWMTERRLEDMPAAAE